MSGYTLQHCDALIARRHDSKHETPSQIAHFVQYEAVTLPLGQRILTLSLQFSALSNILKARIKPTNTKRRLLEEFPLKNILNVCCCQISSPVDTSGRVFPLSRSTCSETVFDSQMQRKYVSILRKVITEYSMRSGVCVNKWLT